MMMGGVTPQAVPSPAFILSQSRPPHKTVVAEAHHSTTVWRLRLESKGEPLLLLLFCRLVFAACLPSLFE